jgi:hypothetical protein
MNSKTDLKESLEKELSDYLASYPALDLDRVLVILETYQLAAQHNGDAQVVKKYTEALRVCAGALEGCPDVDYAIIEGGDVIVSRPIDHQTYSGNDPHETLRLRPKLIKKISDALNALPPSPPNRPRDELVRSAIWELSDYFAKTTGNPRHDLVGTLLNDALSVYWADPGERCNKYVNELLPCEREGIREGALDKLSEKYSSERIPAKATPRQHRKKAGKNPS